MRKFWIVSIILILSVSYFAEAKGNGERIASEDTLILVINYPYQIWSSDPTKIHCTLFTQDFKPAHGAVVSVNGKDVGRTDINGTLVFDYVPGSNNSHNLIAKFTEGGRSFSVKKSFASNSRTESFKADMLYIYTDKGVYNPGQEILAAALAWSLKGEYTPVKEAKIQLILQDKAGRIFSGEFVKTNDFGVADARIPIGRDMPEGDYELVVLYEKARETAQIRVKHFTPPIINMKHDLPRYLTDTQAALNASIILDYFAGGRIVSSRLMVSFLNAKAEEVWKREYTGTSEHKISLSRGDLDSIRSKLYPETTIKLRLRVTDSYGQSDELDWDTVYTARPYNCVIELDKDSYPQGEKVQALCKITDIDKQPAKKIKLEMSVPEAGLVKQAETDDKGVCVLEFVMPQAPVMLVVKSPLVKQPLASRYIPFEVQKPMTSKVSEPPRGAGLKTSVSIGFDPGYVPVEKIVHFDLTDISGALVSSGTIPVLQEAGKYIARGSIVSPTWGSMLVNLYVCAIEKQNEGKPLAPQTVGFITEGQHVTFYADKELSITIENFKPAYAPGDKTKFTVSVKGGEGEKCLGVSVTDSAVISLLDPFIKQPVSHFYSPQAKAITTGGAGVLTWPVVDRNWGSPWRDIAFSNWGWKAPGGLVGETYPEESGEIADAITGGEAQPSTPLFAEKSIPTDSSTSKMMQKEEKEANGKGYSADRRRDGGTEVVTPEKTIVIRTNFPQTSFWNPALITKNGKASFEVSMPDEITRQSISILATDKSGYIGLARNEVSVTQPLFIRSLLPASIRVGDTLEVRALVRNSTDKEITCSARLDSKGNSQPSLQPILVSGKNERSVTIPALGAGIASWTIEARLPGTASFSVIADTGRFSDAEKKSITILPQGEPEVTEIRGIAPAGGALVRDFALRSDSAYSAVSLNVSLPNVFPAIEAWWAFGNAPWYSPWGVAAGAIMNSAMLKYVRNSRGGAYENQEQEALLVKLLMEAHSLLVSSQLQQGAWGFYQVRQPSESGRASSNASLYYTVYCLRGLLEIKNSGLSVNDKAITAAISYILSARNSKGLWSSKGAYFWDVTNDDTDASLSCEIFEVLMSAFAMVFPQGQLGAELVSLEGKIINVLNSGIEEPQAISSAVAGLMYYKQATGDMSVESMMSGNIERLIRIKRTGYWEPHWYHAYGGMVELNAKIMLLLSKYDANKYASYLREGVTWLLSTRTSWGAWHNEIGTASAITALLEAGVFGDEIQSDIVISVNGREIEKVRVDPGDPFLSAAKLAYYEITKWCVPGKNTVSIRYTGKLDASVILEVKEWRGNAPSVSKVGLTRKTPSKLGLGQSATVRLSLTASRRLGGLRIEESIPSNASVIERSLDKLREDRLITGYKIDGNRLFLFLVNVEKPIELSYKLLPVMRGKSVFHPALVYDSELGTLLGASTPSQELIVE